MRDGEHAGDGAGAGGRSEGHARVGVISDTHGFLRSEVFEAFADVDRILHAGDVGDPAILLDLGVLAPVTAVWGNVDGAAVRGECPESAEVEVGGVRFALLHGHQATDYDGLPGRFPDADVVVHGHSHLPALRRVDGTVILNPGSAGPRRFGKPVTLATVTVRAGRPSVQHLDLQTGKVFTPDR